MPKTKATAKEFLKKLGILNEDGSPTQDYLDSLPKGDEFYYAVGFRWDESKCEKSEIGFYESHGEIQHGNMEAAEEFRTYCQQQLDNKNPKHKYRIYKVEEIPITESK